MTQMMSAFCTLCIEKLREMGKNLDELGAEDS